MEVKTVPSMGWTRKSAAVSVLLAMENHRKEAGQRLVRLREARGWNQEDLAHHAGVSVKTISRFENGRHDGRRSTIRSLVEALEISEADLLGPPPAPLGLSTEPDQLDRIEAMLNQVLVSLGATPRTEDADHPRPSGTLGRAARTQPPKPQDQKPARKGKGADRKQAGA